MRQIQLYIHIPFCERKCAYCDFLSFQSCESERKKYVTALIKEISLYKKLGKQVKVSSIFIGGGTPSVIDGKYMEDIFDEVRKVFDILPEAEISIECNPGTVTEEKLESYKNCGINRISLGLQATNNEELKNLGRIHTYEDFVQSYGLVRKAGFKNINIDLMSAIPGQSVKSWKQTLKRIVELNPEHISAYSLIIEEGTKFWDVYGEDKPREDDLPSEADEREMYYLTKRILGEEGYNRYEVSNYSKDDLHCKHNLGYWDRAEYLGIGLGASSLLISKVEKSEEVRTKNVEDMQTYIDMVAAMTPPILTVETISKPMQMEEFMFLGLRKIDGVSKYIFTEQFNIDIEEIFGEVLDKMYSQGLLKEINGQIKFTEKGIDLSNMVLSEFLID